MSEPEDDAIAAAVHLELVRLKRVLEHRGVNVDDAGLRLIGEWVGTAGAHHTIGQGSIRLVVSTLAAAALTTSRRRLTVDAVQSGWRSIQASGNCPPHECFETSIVQRRQWLSGRLTPLPDILGSMDE